MLYVGATGRIGRKIALGKPRDRRPFRRRPRRGWDDNTKVGLEGVASEVVG